MKFTDEEKYKEALRELKMRKSVYARTLMAPHEIKYKIEIMEEIAEDYRLLAEKERLL